MQFIRSSVSPPKFSSQMCERKSAMPNRSIFCSYRSSILSFLLALLLLGFVLGYEAERSVKHRKKRHFVCDFGLADLVKEFIYNAIEDVRDNDPLSIGNSTDNKLRDGVFKGFSTLSNETSLDVLCSDDSVVFSTTLGMKNPEICYKWFWKFLARFSGSICMTAKEIHFSVAVTLNMTNGIHFTVTNALVTKLENFKFGFTGLGPINSVVKGLAKLAYKVWTERVTKKIEDSIRKALTKQLGSISMSLK